MRCRIILRRHNVQLPRATLAEFFFLQHRLDFMCGQKSLVHELLNLGEGTKHDLINLLGKLVCDDVFGPENHPLDLVNRCRWLNVPPFEEVWKQLGYQSVGDDLDQISSGRKGYVEIRAYPPSRNLFIGGVAILSPGQRVRDPFIPLRRSA